MEEPQIQGATERDFWNAFADLVRSAPPDLIDSMPADSANEVYALQSEINKYHEERDAMMAYAKTCASSMTLSDTCEHCQNYKSLTEENKLLYLAGMVELSKSCEHITPYSKE